MPARRSKSASSLPVMGARNAKRRSSGRAAGRPSSREQTQQRTSAKPSPARSSPAASAPRRARSKPRRSRGGDDADVPQLSARAVTLFNKVMTGRGLQSTVQGWIAHFGQEPEVATCDLLAVFSQACGAKGAITNAMLEQPNLAVDVLIRTVDGDQSYLIGGRTAKDAKSRLSKFMHALIDNGRDALWLNEESCQLGNALVDATHKLSQDMEAQDLVIQELGAPQVNGKPLKKAQRRRLDEATARLQEFDSLFTRAEKWLDEIFMGVIVHRYRDVCHDIRRDTLTALGYWIINSWEKFLDDTFLKYIGWSLSDKHHEVRLCVLHTLEALYGNQDTREQLGSFTQRFKDNILFMVWDANTDVAVQAFAVLHHLCNMQALSPEQIQLLFAGLQSDQAPVASAAAKLAKEVLLDAQLPLHFELHKIEDEAHQRRLSMKTLVRLITSTDMIDNMVRAGWDHISLFQNTGVLFSRPGLAPGKPDQIKRLILVPACEQDFDCYFELLEQDNVTGEEALDESAEAADTSLTAEEEANFLHMFAAAMKVSRESKSTSRSEWSAVSKKFVRKAGDLLEKHAHDDANTAAIIKALSEVDPKAYSGAAAKELDRLFPLVAKALLGANDIAAIRAVVNFLGDLAESKMAVAAKAETCMQSILEDLQMKLDQYEASGLVTFDPKTDDETDGIVGLRLTLKRLASCATRFPVVPEALHQLLNSMVERAIDLTLDSEASADGTHRVTRLESLEHLCVLQSRLLAICLATLDTKDAAAKASFLQNVARLEALVKKALSSLFANTAVAACIGYCELCIVSAQLAHDAEDDEASESDSDESEKSDAKADADAAAAPSQELVLFCSEGFATSVAEFVRDMVAFTPASDADPADVVEYEGLLDSLLSIFTALATLHLLPESVWVPLVPHYSTNAKVKHVFKAYLKQLRQQDSSTSSVSAARVILNGLTTWALTADEKDQHMVLEVTRSLAMTFSQRTDAHRRQLHWLFQSLCKVACTQLAEGSRSANTIFIFALAREVASRMGTADREYAAKSFDSIEVEQPMEPKEHSQEWQPYFALVDLLSGASKGAKTPASARRATRRIQPDEDIEDDGEPSPAAAPTSARRAGRRANRGRRSEPISDDEVGEGDEADEDEADGWISTVPKRAKTSRQASRASTRTRGAGRGRAALVDAISDDSDDDDGADQTGAAAHADDSDEIEDEPSQPPKRSKRVTRAPVLHLDSLDDVEEVAPITRASDESDLEEVL
ncbi:uncharacterized protein MONBRDRAFT_31739 [Monosiga brevicollis MX1]|uniref:SCD domain-containing protein n=1 Tax=Monosiga brevicollis TaxID=81824 RepID=A9UUD5_MONBE|nr:uncharacterized protein MONBRDRAFT_31739 [Monosiga brevicollis MX1]EDQ91077.1 predicted protein [Monosiga brevicollis MX1]|eukprot:XP_001744374.1 hypothetical protein [Monosiga brevicollis MX1]